MKGNRKGRGWYRDHYKHKLAGKGIPTKTKNENPHRSDGDSFENVEDKEHKEFEEGERIEVSAPIDLYPNTIVEKGETGKVITKSNRGKRGILYRIKLDKYHEGLEEWDNVLNIRDDYPDTSYITYEKVESPYKQPKKED